MLLIVYSNMTVESYTFLQFIYDTVIYSKIIYTSSSIAWHFQCLSMYYSILLHFMLE